MTSILFLNARNTRFPEFGTENLYQKTGTINRHENTAMSYSLPEAGTRKIQYKLHVNIRRARNRFSAPISSTCVIGITKYSR